MERSLDLPSFDARTTLAQTLVYHRFRPRINQALREADDPVFLGLCVTHFVRLQRLAEGLAAVATVGLVPEVQWLSRPALELFASQCVLQFHELSFAKTRAERISAYFAHADFTQSRLLKKHAHWPGHTSAVAERNANICRLDDQARDYNFKPRDAWHKLPLDDALKHGIESKERVTGKDFASSMKDNIGVMVDQFNAGIHGSPYAGRVHMTEDHHVADLRQFDEPLWATLPSLLASASLEMVAYEIGQASLIDGMLRSAEDEVADNARLSPFRTCTLNLLDRGS